MGQEARGSRCTAWAQTPDLLSGCVSTGKQGGTSSLTYFHVYKSREWCLVTEVPPKSRFLLGWGFYGTKFRQQSCVFPGLLRLKWKYGFVN